jgi:hypothetical protein
MAEALGPTNSLVVRHPKVDFPVVALAVVVQVVGMDKVQI